MTTAPTDEQLQALITAFNTYVREHKDEVVAKFDDRDNGIHDLVNPLNLNHSSDDSFARSLIKYIDKTDKSLYRKAGPRTSIIEHVPAVRAALQYVITSPDDAFAKYENVTSGSHKITGFDTSFWSPILQQTDGLPAWNTVTERFMKLIGRPIARKTGASEQGYKQLAEVVEHLGNLSGHDHNYVSHLMKYAVDYEPEVSARVLKS